MPRRTELELAIDTLSEKYERDKALPYVHKPIAWALYYTLSVVRRGDER